MRLSDLFIIFVIIAVILGGILVIMVVTEERPVQKAGPVAQIYKAEPSYDIEKINLLLAEQSMQMKVGSLEKEINDLEDEIDDLKSDLSYETSEKARYMSLYERELDRNRDEDNDDEYDLTVYVEDADTGDPIEDALVEVENGDDDEDYTDDDGRARFKNLEEDDYDVYVSASGYYSEERESLDLDRDRSITIRLDPR